METAQIVQSIRQQEIQQNGISSGISRMLGSGFSFSDIILMMLSNTGLGGDLQNEKAIPSQYGEIIDILVRKFDVGRDAVSCYTTGKRRYRFKKF